ncbi:F-box domain containing protein [Tanacetum coccineum]|uniref:F-box domain containing protein n=1 Tax=Tanacetum coccineum TaxID=301880 RepID=A0ABQ4X360_9ASTR
MFVELTHEATKTPSPKHQLSSPSAPNAPSKTQSTKGTSSSSIDYTPKSPTSSISPSTNGYLNSPTSPPLRVPPPPPTQENASIDITLTLLPITPLDVQFLVKALALLGYEKAFFMVVIFFFKELGGQLQVVRIFLFGPKNEFHTRKTFTSVIHEYKAQDNLIWHYDSKGVYTVRSGYHQALNWKKNGAGHASSSGCLIEFWKQTWRLKTVPKIKNFWWMACSNALAIREALFLRNYATSSTCTITSRVISLLQPFQSKDASTKFLSSFATLAWSIWKARNRYIFDQVKISPTGVILEAQISDDVFQSTLSSDTTILPTTKGISHENSHSSAAIGIVARNCNGSLLQCVGEKCRSESVLAAKLSVIRSSCILAATNGWRHAIIESDSQSAISLAATEDVPPWALASNEFAAVLGFTRM